MTLTSSARVCASTLRESGASAIRPDGYESPRLTVLGTLAQLTQGGDVSGESDGFGAAGGSGMLP